METSLERMFGILEKIEQRQKITEKRMEEMTEELQKLQLEKKRINRKRKTCLENHAPIKKGSNDLTRLGIECILSFMDPIKRLEFAMQCESMREIEKSVSMHLKKLYISFETIHINDCEYSVQHSFCSYNGGNEGCVQISPNELASWYLYEFEETAKKIVFDFFAGRNKLRVDDCRIALLLPFELDIDALSIRIFDGQRCCMQNYLNTIRNVDTVIFFQLDKVEDLRQPMVRNARRIRKFNGNESCFLEELPNLQAQIILIHFESDESLLVDLILKWSETRNGKVGFELYLATTEDLQDAVFLSDRLLEAGFFSRIVGEEEEEEESLCLQMDNNSEAVLSVPADIENDSVSFYSRIRSSKFLHIKISRC